MSLLAGSSLKGKENVAPKKILYVSCPHCNQVLSDHGRLAIHCRAKHLEKSDAAAAATPIADLAGTTPRKSHDCQKCGKCLGTKQSLRYHMAHVHGGSTEKGVAWPEVLDQYPGIQFTKVSPSSSGTASDKPIVLKTGGKVVITTDQSKEAKLKKSKTAKIRVPCLYCKVMLSGAEKLKPHIKSKHPGAKVVG